MRLAKRAPKQASWNKLHSAIETKDTKKDTTSFWKWWRSIYSYDSNKAAPVVEGCANKVGITAVFEKSFQNNSKPNNVEKVEFLNKSFKDKYAEFSAVMTQIATVRCISFQCQILLMQ